VTQTLRGRLDKLAGSTPGDLPDLAPDLPDPGSWALAELCGEVEASETADEGRPQYEQLTGLLEQCCSAALALSDTLSRRYFSHATSASHCLGA
jgi:hypothetical protein